LFELGLAGLRKDVAFAMEQFHMKERWACKLVALDRSSYRYVPSRITTRNCARS